MWKRIKYHPFFIKLFNWEYWPSYIANIPVVFFWMIQSVRARNFLFFTTVNPAIATGGLFGEEKHKIYDLIPAQFLPKTIYFPPDTDRKMIPQRLRDSGFQYPVVCKPNIGERGMQVNVLYDDDALIAHTSKMTAGMIVQERIDYPLELSIMCHRFPISKKQAVTSICKKAFLSVTGDGTHSIAELIDENPRAILQKETLSKRMDLMRIPAKDEYVLLEAIGNHCRGTQFLNANTWITPGLERHMLDLLAQMPGIHYGRFDLRTRSIEDICAGKNFLIMEFNGVGSEPAHIYDPSYPIRHAYRDIWRHWQILLAISREQKTRGVQPMQWKETIDALRAYFAYKKKANLTFGA